MILAAAEVAAGGPAAVVAWLLERLHRRGVAAPFFVLGELARAEPAAVRSIAAAGHEVASHGRDRRRPPEPTPRRGLLDGDAPQSAPCSSARP